MEIMLCVFMIVVVILFVVGINQGYKAVSNLWEVRLQCPCGWHTEAELGDSSHIVVGCCPECGRRKPITAGKSGDWELRVMKWTDGAWEAQK